MGGETVFALGRGAQAIDVAGPHIVQDGFEARGRHMVAFVADYQVVGGNQLLGDLLARDVAGRQERMEQRDVHDARRLVLPAADAPYDGALLTALPAGFGEKLLRPLLDGHNRARSDYSSFLPCRRRTAP